MFNHYYLHFRNAIDPVILSALESEGVQIEPEFETSVSLGTDLSFGQVKRIIKSNLSSDHCILLKVKQLSELLIAE